MTNEILDDLKEGCGESINALKRDLNKVRTGRANPAMLNSIRVDYYGTPTPLSQVGAVKVPEPRMITIQPWEKNMISAVEKAIMQSDLGLTPSSDGILIRLPIPQLTGERRKELTRQVRELGERSKIALRAHRRDANELLKGLEKDGEISEDDLHRTLAKVQDQTNAFTKRVEEIIAAKEEEILEI